MENHEEIFPSADDDHVTKSAYVIGRKTNKFNMATSECRVKPPHFNCTFLQYRREMSANK